MKVKIKVLDYSKGKPYKLVDSWIINTTSKDVSQDIAWYQENYALADYQFIEGQILEEDYNGFVASVN